MVSSTGVKCRFNSIAKNLGADGESDVKPLVAILFAPSGAFYVAMHHNRSAEAATPLVFTQPTSQRPNNQGHF